MKLFDTFVIHLAETFVDDHGNQLGTTTQDRVDLAIGGHEQQLDMDAAESGIPSRMEDVIADVRTAHQTFSEVLAQMGEGRCMFSAAVSLNAAEVHTLIKFIERWLDQHCGPVGA